jgi:cation:H+ antiporter
VSLLLESSLTFMPLDLLMLAVGGAMLYFGAEWLVQGAAGLAVRLGVAPLLIGLTIVSYATSAPELAVSVSAALGGDSPLVLGNVFGSNIANIGLILGVTALISPPHSDGSMARRELIVLLGATVAAPAMLIDGTLGAADGVILLLGSVAFTWLTIRWSRSRPADLDEVPTEETREKGTLVAVGLLGLCVLIAGGEAFVRGAVGLAQALGVDERVIGLTIVAFGTSVPELAASVVAALRGHSDLAIGNVIGSNIFNLLLVLGTAAAIDPISVDLGHMGLELSFLGILTFGAVLVLSRKRTITRIEGALLTGSYVGFLAVLVFQMH